MLICLTVVASFSMLYSIFEEIHHNLYIQSALDEYFHCFQFGDITNNAFNNSY